METEKGKTCARCKQVLPASSYHRDRRYKDGLNRYCIPCARVFRQGYNARHATIIRPADWLDGTKECTRCKRDLPKTEFHRVKSKKSGLRSICRTCVSEMDLNRSQEAKDKENAQRRAIYWSLKDRKNYLKTRYGLTIEAYDALHAKQNGLCAICGNPESQLSNQGTRKRLAVDHDHLTGQVRGLLCTHCNIAIGILGDDHKRLERAIEYLQEAAKQRRIVQLELFRRV